MPTASIYYYYDYTRSTALFPGLPGWAGTRKVKPIWILLKQETVSGSGISWTICKSAPLSRQITSPVPHHSVFTGRMPFLPPNQQRQSTEGQTGWVKAQKITSVPYISSSYTSIQLVYADNWDEPATWSSIPWRSWRLGDQVDWNCSAADTTLCCSRGYSATLCLSLLRHPAYMCKQTHTHTYKMLVMLPAYFDINQSSN